MALKSNWQPGDRLNAANVNVITTTINHATRSAGLILPFYFYPNTPYTDASCLRLLDLIREYHNVPVIVIVNPVSPSSYDLNWEVLIRQLKAAGATVVGYVATGDLTSGWVARDPSLVHADIDAWQSTWPNSPIDGIFLDVLPFDPGTANANVTLYLGYRTYCDQRSLSPVIGNPGANVGYAWFDTPVADVMMCWENSVLPDEASDMLQNYVNGHVFYPYTGRGMIVYGQSSLDLHFVRRMRRYAQWFFVTNVSGANPYNALPSYLEQLFAALSDTQVPGRGITALTFATSTAWDAGETNVAKLTLTGNGTLALPSNLIAGNEYTLVAKQDGTGGRTLAFASGYKFASSVVLPLTGTANQTHAVRFVYDGTNMLATSVNTY